MNGLPDNARCLDCGYALRGLTEARCPECGRAFDPVDNSTYRWEAALPAWLRRYEGPPTNLHVWFTIFAGAWWLVAQTSPAGLLFLVPLSCVVTVVTPLILMGVYLLHAFAVMGAHAESAAGSRWRWAVLPLVAVLAASTLVENWPLRLRFELSRGALEAEVQRLMIRPQGDAVRLIEFVPGPARIGLYRVQQRRVYRDSSGAVTNIILFTHRGTLNATGFRYCPTATTSQPTGALPAGWGVYIHDR